MSAHPAAREKLRAPDPGFWRGRRVLVTGHTGFKGAWLSLWLQRLGAEVTGFADSVPTDPSLYTLARVGETLGTITGDIRDLAAVQAAFDAGAPEVVIHLAAQPLVRRSYQAPLETFQINVLGTANVLEAVREAGASVRAVVVVTSDKCYAAAPPDHALAEDDPLGAADPYSSSKACAELVAASYRSSFMSDPDGTRVATARAGNVIGGGDWSSDRLLPDIIRAATSGEELLVRNPAAVRPWQHVINPLSGYLLLAEALWESPDHACAWNFGPAAEDTRPVSWIVERAAALWGEGLRWKLDAQAHPPEASHLQLDSARARDRLGWRAPLTLDDALAATVHWHRALQSGADMHAVTVDQLESATLAGEPALAEDAGTHP